MFSMRMDSEPPPRPSASGTATDRASESPTANSDASAPGRKRTSTSPGTNSAARTLPFSADAGVGSCAEAGGGGTIEAPRQRTSRRVSSLRGNV